MRSGLAPMGSYAAAATPTPMPAASPAAAPMAPSQQPAPLLMGPIATTPPTTAASKAPPPQLGAPSA
eukprot:660111-Prorocentrum_lima.AAC.1